MKPRWLIALLVVACALAGLFAWRQLRPNPTFQGQPVFFWVRELFAPTQLRRQEATAAVHALGSNSVPVLAKLLRRQDSLLRCQAWVVAAKLPAALGAPLRRLAGPLDAQTVRRGAARALGLLGPQAQAAAPALGQALHDPDLQLRWEAAQALGHLGRAGLPPLASVLSDTNAQLRYSAVSALGCADPQTAPRAAPLLFKALTDQDKTVSFSAGESLARLGTNVLSFLQPLLTNPAPLIRQRAARALGRARDHDLVVPPLVQMLHDPEPACRQAAVQTLTRLGLPDRTMTQAYLEALKDPDAGVRLGAVTGLAQALAQRPLIVPALAACLQDQAPAVRLAAARALGHFGRASQAAAASLNRSLQDSDPSVRAAARQALASLAPPAPR